MTTPEGAKLETVVLLEDEHVVERGTARSTWHVHRADGWVRVRDVPGARIEHLDPPPGTVWRCRIEVDVALGTELLHTQSFPAISKRTPLAHLEQGRAAGRRVHRALHRVGKGGRLEQE